MCPWLIELGVGIKHTRVDRMWPHITTINGPGGLYALYCTNNFKTRIRVTCNTNHIINKTNFPFQRHLHFCVSTYEGIDTKL